MTRKLFFNINDLKLSKAGDFSKIPFGTDDEVLCCFNFNDKEWNKCKAVAIFMTGLNKSGYLVPIYSDGTCKVPSKVLSSSFFRIKVIRAKNNIHDTTNTLLIVKEE